MFKKVYFHIVLGIVNYILKGTRFFKLKRALLRLIGISIGLNTKIVGPLYLRPINRLTIGSDSWIGRNFNIDGNGNVQIGDRCDIAPNLTINTGGHEIGDSNRRAGVGLRTKTVIGNGTWIGTNVVIINGSTIGESVVVAACSCIINDSPDNCLIAGVPAKFKKDLA
ncbi:acyltransferase [Bacillus gobiensis]|uniref:acyltransferase n=1 Tax=Bacillus gobiensis TaxID=1441095 RepID=UPI003D255598